ncbi:unnamed protein product, partial [Mesorhabditis spiculigera]
MSDDNSPLVTVKWMREKYELPLNVDEEPEAFKSQLFSLTGVPPSRQKLIIKGKTIQNSWDGLQVAPGMVMMMMGSTQPLLPEIQVSTPGEQPSQGAQRVEQYMPAGLENCGNSCYMNSVLQAMHTVPEYREVLERFQLSPNFQQKPRENLVHTMRASSRIIDHKPAGFMNTLEMLLSLHAVFPQFKEKMPNGMYQQQDANECFTGIMRVTLDELKRQEGCRPKGSEANIDRYFTGVYEITYTNTENPEENPETAHEEFLQLSCYLGQDIRYMKTGLTSKMKETVTKFSQTLGKDAVYNKETLIERLPGYLSVQFSHVKILKDVQFPLRLDVADMCTPRLQKAMAVHREEFRQDDAKLAYDSQRRQAVDEADEKGIPLPYSFPDDHGSNNSGFYDLQAVITHKGRSAQAGHYVAWVRMAEDKWVKCDDDEVTPVHVEDVKKLSGGGDYHTAYVLLYGPRICHKFDHLLKK